MKKFLTAMVAGATLFSAGAAFAANQVQVTLTSPTILKTGCEKAGAITFAFDNGTNIKAGDWWYLDLPVNVSLCKSYDYMIGATSGTGLTLTTASGLMTIPAGEGFPVPVVEGQTGPLSATVVAVPGVAGGNAAFTNLMTPWTDTDASGTVNDAAELVNGVWTDANADGIVDLGEISAPYWPVDTSTDGLIDAGELLAPYLIYETGLTANVVDTGEAIYMKDRMAFRVVGNSDSRRITITALGSATTDSITVMSGYKLNIKIMDGKSYNVNGATTNMILINKDTDAAGTLVYGKNNYSGTADEVIGLDNGTAAVEPAVENTLCINASTYGGELVFLSFASLNDKFTFTGDSQIAHTGASVAISLKNCKGATSGQILIGGQNACAFDYEVAGTTGGYCATWAANKVAIQTNAATFGDTGDKYALTLESLTDGVYFQNAAVALKAYTQAQSASSAWCTPTTPNVPMAPAFVAYVGSTVTTSFPTNSCSVAAANKVNKLATAPGAFTMNDINTLETNLPQMVYDKTVIGAGVEAKVRLSLDKYPCGSIFSGSQTVGTFVTTCTAAAGTTALMFPFFPPMDPTAAPGWWGGYVIVNGGSNSGTAVLTYTDAAGATGTYTTAAIAAGAQFNGSGITSADLTAGTGTFSTTSNYSIQAVCNFTMAAGFAFVSSPEAAASYVAYTNSGWQ